MNCWGIVVGKEDLCIMNCKHCGAPVEANDEVCQYCGKLTDYGEHMLEERKRTEKEEERRRALDNLPVMKYVSMTFMIFIYVITLGSYSPYWYATRIAPLNALNTGKKFPAWLAGIFALAWCAMFILPGSEATFGITSEMSQEIYNYSLGIGFVASVYLAFAARNILQEYAAKFMERPVAVQTVAPSAIMLILFGSIYLQHCVNKMIAMKILAPKI
jgi:hypothetical protein